MGDRLQRAIDVLRIQDTYLNWASSYLAEGFDPKYDSGVTELHLAFKHLVRRLEVLELRNEVEPQQILRVFIEVGTRWTRPGEDDGPPSEPVAQIEAAFVIEYLMDSNPGQEALEVFAENNASYHLWPYWREYLSMQCLRMNLPKVALPMQQFPANRAANQQTK